MSLNILYGPATSGKTTEVYKLATSLSASGKKVTLIVPNQACMNAERRLVELASGHGIMDTSVLSFTRLAYRLMEEAGHTDLPLLDDLGKCILLRHIIRDLGDDLKVFVGKEKNAGFIDEIKSLISEFSEYLVKPENLSNAKKDGDSLYNRKLDDIALIYASYLKKIEGIYKTPENTLELSYPHIGESEYLKNNIFILDGFTGLTPTQYDFISRILTVSKDVYITLTGDKDLIDCSKLNDGFVSFKENPGIFDMSTEMGNRMVSICAQNGILVNSVKYIDYKYNCEDIYNLKNSVFRYDGSKAKEPENIEIRRLTDTSMECRYVASTIADLLRSKKYQYKDIAIVTGDLQGMSRGMCRALSEYGIKYHFDERKAIANSPLVSFINYAISVVEDDFKSGDVLDFVSSPLSNISEKENAIFTNYLSCYNYRGLSQYKKTWEYSKRLGKQVDMALINSIKDSVVNTVAGIPKKATCHELIIAIYNMIVEAKVNESLKAMADAIPEADEYYNKCLIGEYEKVYDSVIKLLEQLDGLMGEEEITLKEFKDLFMAGIKRMTVGYLPDGEDLVIYGDIYRTRLNDIKVLFLVDAIEGVIPRSQGSDTILTHEDRNMLSAADVSLAPQIKDNPEREEYYIYLTLAKPSDKLFITYSNVSVSGEQAKPSYIVNQVAKTFSGIQIYENIPDSVSALLGHDRGFSYMVKRSFGDNEDTSDKLLNALLKYYKTCNENEDIILSDIRSYIDTFFDENLNEETAKKLYGDSIRCSVSRMETFAKCPFSHFMNYGLGVKETNTSEPMSADYGNALHKALENFLTIYKGDQTDFSAITNSEIEAHAIRCLHDVIKNFDDNLYLEDPKNAYLASRMDRVMVITADALINQLRKSKFTIGSLEETLKLQQAPFNILGKIDRIDIADIAGDRLVKIIDYKTGTTSMNLSKIYYGLQLQLMVYMDYVLNSVYKDAIPAAAFYQKVDEPELSTLAGGSELIDIQRRALMPKGRMNDQMLIHGKLDKEIVENDAYVPGYKSDVINLAITSKQAINGIYTKNILSEDRIRALSKYATLKLKEFGEDMYKGRCEMTQVQFGKEQTNSCSYCAYKNACGFDRKNFLFRDKKIVLSPLSEDSIFADIDNKLKG